MRVPHSSLPRARRIPLRGELPLLELPGRYWLGLQGVRGIEREKVETLQGSDSLLVWGDDEANHTRCGNCGSLLYSVVRDGAYVHVAMGSLVDEPAIRPTEHIFVGSKAHWFEITDDLPQSGEY
jgi:hypothetical protein